MNILFKNVEHFKMLKDIAIYKIVVGSQMYGLDDKYSDIDYLYILPIAEEVQRDIFRTHHQLQFKTKGEDHVFVFLDTYLKNIFNGDSTINFEVLQELKPGTLLDWLLPYKEKIYTYTIIKAYLGFAKRDIKYFPKDKDLRSKRRKVKHIYRGYVSAKMLYEKDFKIEYLKKDKRFKEIDKLETDIEFKVELSKLTTQLSDLRGEINLAVDKGELNYFLFEDTQSNLSQDFYKFLDNKKHKELFNRLSTEAWVNIMKYYYHVNENGLKY